MIGPTDKAWLVHSLIQLYSDAVGHALTSHFSLRALQQERLIPTLLHNVKNGSITEFIDTPALLSSLSLGNYSSAGIH